MHKTFEEDSELRFAIWESEQTEQVKQITIAKRSKCIERFCKTLKCTTDTVLEQGDCAIISTFLQLQRPHSTENINMYRQQLSQLERLNPQHYFHLSFFGGPHIENANKEKMLFQHARYVAIPGTFIEQIDYQAISNLERATITLYCIIVETNQELDVQVFLPTSGVPLRCLNYLLLITEHPVGSHVQPIYFWQTPQRTIVNIDAETYKHDLIKKVQPLESYIVPVTSLKPARITLQDALSDELRSEIVLQRSSSSPRLLASPSIIITLILTLIFLIANIMISLLDDNFAPDFTVASRTATGHNGLSLSPYVVAKIEHLPSLYNMTLAVTDDKFSLSTVHYISDVCNYSTSACYFSYLTGCRIGEAKNPGPHRAKSKSAATKSITRSDAKKLSVDAAHADLVKAHNKRSDAKRMSVDAAHADLVKAHNEQPTAAAVRISIAQYESSASAAAMHLENSAAAPSVRQSRFSTAQNDCANTTAAMRFQESLTVPLLVPAIPAGNPYHVSSEDATTAGLQAASDYFDISNISRQTCACCNERCKTKAIKRVKAEGHWLDRIINRLNWNHTKYKVNDVTKSYYSAPAPAVHLKGLPLAPNGVTVELDGSTTVKLTLICAQKLL